MKIDKDTTAEERRLRSNDENDELEELDAGASQGGVIALPLAVLRTDGGTQTRARLDPNTVEDYASAMLEAIKRSKKRRARPR